MNEQDYQKLKDLGAYFRRMNGKIKLLGLLRKAKEEYDQNKLKDCMSTCKKILASDPKNATALRGLGCSIMPTIVSLTGACLFRVVWICTVFRHFKTLECLYISYPISWTLTFTAHIVCFLIVYRKLIKKA